VVGASRLPGDQRVGCRRQRDLACRWSPCSSPVVFSMGVMFTVTTRQCFVGTALSRRLRRLLQH
jgi:hypothetical protein